jgi:hypothetical protein
MEQFCTELAQRYPTFHTEEGVGNIGNKLIVRFEPLVALEIAGDRKVKEAL